jgi:hypothetical protein
MQLQFGVAFVGNDPVSLFWWQLLFRHKCSQIQLICQQPHFDLINPLILVHLRFLFDEANKRESGLTVRSLSS